MDADKNAAAPPAPVAARSPCKQSPHHGQKQQRKAKSDQRNSKPKRRRQSLKQPLTKDMPRVMSELLKEPKVALLHRVVKHVGPKVAWQLLRETLRLEKDGGQQVNAQGSGKPELFLVVDELSHEFKPRRRTSGGVFFTLLKDKVSKEVYRSIYEVEDKKKKDAKKRARSRQRQRMDSTLAKLGFGDLTLSAAGAQEDTEAAAAEDGEVAEAMQL
ncbi:hypothetical protein PHYBOEH_009436 [Phytophthora boehmeriae]|uniref:Phosphorylated adapter RNA export protein RNA-binding domain-containing protein n=1 Tax=Phytophthora boehmeriae TaxID=109152 RepID=A0A8T1VSN3_9STRA|nr:hypothetical protein PHYBOEH_009436 [Phytophthora boehmeriae]